MDHGCDGAKEMTNEILDERALYYLNKMQGIDEKTRREALLIREEIYLGLKVKDMVNRYLPKEKDFRIVGNKLIIRDIDFVCDGFMELSEGWLEEIIVYMISMPPLEDFSEEDLLRSYYGYIWQNVYIEAKKDLILGEGKKYLSFGPGYFGMALEENEKIYSLLEGRKIGVSIKNHSMFPAKTCTGLCLKIKDEFIEIVKKLDPCKYCVGNKNACDMCQAGKGR